MMPYKFTITEEMVFDILENNPGSQLSLHELFDRIIHSQGWEMNEASLEQLKNLLVEINKKSNKLNANSSLPEGPFYSLYQKEDKGFDGERDLDEPLISWLQKKLKVYATALPSGTSSGNQGKGSNLWRYPDVVGYRRILDHKGSNALHSFLKRSGAAEFAIYSFEVKQDITANNIREYFFQTLANSSWANYRYLVTSFITNEALEEFRKLSRRYEMGLILIRPARDENKIIATEDSSLLIESSYQPLEAEVINKLYENWSSFREWINQISS